MRKAITICFVFLLVACNTEKEKIEIEKFIWIEHNQNWIWNPDDLESVHYIEYLDSLNQIKFSKTRINYKQADNMKFPKTRIETKQTDYFKSVAPDSIRGLIIENLYGKRFPICFRRNFDGSTYHGNYYCIIYKFKNDSEHIINYMPYSIPDSLRHFTTYIANLLKISSYSISDSFDRTSSLNIYRDIIIPCFPLAPPPAQGDNQVKYSAPIIVDTIVK